MRKVSGNRWEVTEPTEIRIGKPAERPSQDALDALQKAVSSSGAELVYWFWVSISGDRPHLRLGVAPNDDAVVGAVGSAVEPVWNRFSPANQVFDILRLGDPSLDEAILGQGELLFRRSSA
jgi:hypothetical protein